MRNNSAIAKLGLTNTPSAKSAEDVVQYKLVALDMDHFTESHESRRINIMISKGWQPYGPPVTHGENVFQAMVRYGHIAKECID